MTVREQSSVPTDTSADRKKNSDFRRFVFVRSPSAAFFKQDLSRAHLQRSRRLILTFHSRTRARNDQASKSRFPSPVPFRKESEGTFPAAMLVQGVAATPAMMATKGVLPFRRSSFLAKGALSIQITPTGASAKRYVRLATGAMTSPAPGDMDNSSIRFVEAHAFPLFPTPDYNATSIAHPTQNVIRKNKVSFLFSKFVVERTRTTKEENSRTRHAAHLPVLLPLSIPHSPRQLVSPSPASS